MNMTIGCPIAQLVAELKRKMEVDISQNRASGGGDDYSGRGQFVHMPNHRFAFALDVELKASGSIEMP